MFSDLIKARQHKYIKRVPKAGGGFTYFYREQHGGGVALKEHMRAGAAFRLTHNGQDGHFHINSFRPITESLLLSNKEANEQGDYCINLLLRVQL